nr:nucleotidyl transferase AbiEii/AbiGii toxin family protein [Halovivax cerinus]
MHDVFQVYVDIIPDTTELDEFRNAYGFKPPAEPLLKPVFDADTGGQLAEHVSWSPSAGTLIVSPELLAAMKIRSLPDRDKSHKRVKDVADLHALL